VEVSEDEKITFIRPLSNQQEQEAHGGGGTTTKRNHPPPPTTTTIRSTSTSAASVRSTSAASLLDSYRLNNQLYDQHYDCPDIEGFEGVFDDHLFVNNEGKTAAASCSGRTARTVNIEEDELLLQLGQHGRVNAIAIDKDGFLQQENRSNNSNNGSRTYNSQDNSLLDLLSTHQISQSSNSNSNSQSTSNYSSRIGKSILKKNSDIDCTKSSATSVSTMTKGTSHGNSSTFHSTTGSHSLSFSSSSPRFRQELMGVDAHPNATTKNKNNDNQNTDNNNSTSYCLQRKKRPSPTNNNVSGTTTPQTRNSNHHQHHHNGTMAKALAKLALCGHSARESTLDLEYLVLSLRQALTGPEAAKALRDIVKVLKQSRSGGNTTHNNNDDDDQAACNVSNMSCAELQQELAAKGADHCVISTLWNFPSNVAVQYYGIVALGELVAHGNMANQKGIVLKGGIEVVLTAMKTNAMEESVQEEACRTLKNLMKYYDVAKHQVARHKGIARILQAMMTHPEYANVQRQACYALTSLSCLKSISDELVIKQAHAVLIKTMQHHNDDPYVLAEAWRTLTNIVIHAMNTELDEEIASHGMPLIIRSLGKFADCTVVPIQARGLTLLTHLCYRSPANLESVTMTETLETIYRVLRIWKDDVKVQAAGDKLVQQISRAGYPRANPAAGRRGRSIGGASRSVVPSAPGEPIFRRANSNGRRSIFGGGFYPRSTSTSSGGGSRGHSAVIGQIQNDRGMDVIIDSMQRY